jgi:GxxExxY protein
MDKVERHRLTNQITGTMKLIWLNLGNGLPVGVYLDCLLHELKINNIPYRQDVVIPVIYKGYKPETLMKTMLLVDGEIPVELVKDDPDARQRLKAVLRHSGKNTGILMQIQGKPDSLKIEKITTQKA